MEKLRHEADRRGITVEVMTKVFVQFAIDEANAEVAAMSTVERPDPSPEFVACALEHGRKLMADLHELERLPAGRQGRVDDVRRVRTAAHRPGGPAAPRAPLGPSVDPPIPSRR